MLKQKINYKIYFFKLFIFKNDIVKIDVDLYEKVQYYNIWELKNKENIC